MLNIMSRRTVDSDLHRLYTIYSWRVPIQVSITPRHENHVSKNKSIAEAEIELLTNAGDDRRILRRPFAAGFKL